MKVPRPARLFNLTPWNHDDKSGAGIDPALDRSCQIKDADIIPRHDDGWMNTLLAKVIYRG